MISNLSTVLIGLDGLTEIRRRFDGLDKYFLLKLPTQTYLSDQNICRMRFILALACESQPICITISNISLFEDETPNLIFLAVITFVFYILCFFLATMYK